MTNLLWPGDERADGVFDDEAVLAAMVRVEESWLAALASAGIAPAQAGGTPLAGLVDAGDLVDVAAEAEAGGNPVIPLVQRLRAKLPAPTAAWLHKGLTSQDVLDTALVLCLRDAVSRVEEQILEQARALVGLAERHVDAVMAGRTLTQHAVPVTFGLRAATWLGGLARATVLLRTAGDQLPVQVGGAAGTMAAVIELGRREQVPLPGQAALQARRVLADRLRLEAGAPWHTDRQPLTAVADALVGCADVWGRIAGDVALLGRPEIGEVREPAVAGRGGSSTMPHKNNPVLSVLLRRHALAAPQLAATLHTAAASYVDERPDGAWHAEWDTLRLLARRSVTAASQAAELLAGLQVDVDRMRATAEAARDDLLAEQASISGRVDDLAGYVGDTAGLIAISLDRARTVWRTL